MRFLLGLALLAASQNVIPQHASASAAAKMRDATERLLAALPQFDASQGDGNHVHTVWRDFSGDFGRDLLRMHYQAAKGTPHKH